MARAAPFTGGEADAAEGSDRAVAGWTARGRPVDTSRTMGHRRHHRGCIDARRRRTRIAASIGDVLRDVAASFGQPAWSARYTAVAILRLPVRDPIGGSRERSTPHPGP